MATQASTGAQGALGGAGDGCEWLSSLAQGESSVFVQGCSSNLWLVGEGRAAGHGLVAFFLIIFSSGVAVLLLPHQSLGSLRALLLENIPSMGILIALA